MKSCREKERTKKNKYWANRQRIIISRWIYYNVNLLSHFFWMAYVRARYARLNFNFIIYDWKFSERNDGWHSYRTKYQNSTKIYIKWLFIPFQKFSTFFGFALESFCSIFHFQKIQCIPLNWISEPEQRPNAHELRTDSVRLCFTVNVIVSWNFDFVWICFFFSSLEWFEFEKHLIEICAKSN